MVLSPRTGNSFGSHLGFLCLGLNGVLSARGLRGHALRCYGMFLDSSRGRVGRLRRSLLCRRFLGNTGLAVIRRAPLGNDGIDLLVGAASRTAPVLFRDLHLARRRTGKGSSCRRARFLFGGCLGAVRNASVAVRHGLIHA